MSNSRLQRPFSFSPSPDEIGSQAPANEHVEMLCEILLTYGFYEKDLGELNCVFDSYSATCLGLAASGRGRRASLADSQISTPSTLPSPPAPAPAPAPSSPPTVQSNSRLVCPGDLGYVQGMSDLCAPLYVIQKADEVMTFWCFQAVMKRMVCVALIAL